MWRLWTLYVCRCMVASAPDKLSFAGVEVDSGLCMYVDVWRYLHLISLHLLALKWTLDFVCM